MLPYYTIKCGLERERNNPPQEVVPPTTGQIAVIVGLASVIFMAAIFAVAYLIQCLPQNL